MLTEIGKVWATILFLTLFFLAHFSFIYLSVFYYEKDLTLSGATLFSQASPPPHLFFTSFCVFLLFYSQINSSILSLCSPIVQCLVGVTVRATSSICQFLCHIHFWTFCCFLLFLSDYVLIFLSSHFLMYFLIAH